MEIGIKNWNLIKVTTLLLDLRIPFSVKLYSIFGATLTIPEIHTSHLKVIKLLNEE